jgi:hypothetical protein
MKKIKEFIKSELGKYPKSNMPNDEYDCGFEIITADRQTQAMKVYSSVVVTPNIEDMEESHIKLINSAIKDHSDMQCYVRIMPEYFEGTGEDKLRGFYTRLQFKKVVKPDESK